ncbi:hypothetical protein [Marinigracilibium pacificum]|uniref:Uncharacterized protein n=1 Tax=Marinigracilibium pacificum TaxID=2729599 RepID=A0A848J846_9BACT|nr:hypothetical protein [Marinigracilibium pacificum]NMM50660.1 hypothetical protein [Marinigracilibium pacificum]
MKQQLILVIFISIYWTTFSQNSNQIKSGVYGYGTLKIAVDEESDSISGYFQNSINRSGNWDCRFYFKGKLENDTFNITLGSISDFPVRIEPVKGKIYGKNDQITLKLSDAFDADCWRVIQGAEYSGFSFPLDTEKNWTSIEIIKEKTYFYSQPSYENKSNSYVIENDLIFISDKNNGWLFGEYHGKVITKGWIQNGSIKK